MNATGSDRRGLWVVLLAAGLLAAARPGTELLERRQKRIESMSEIERARLRHNFAVFRGLPAEEQERLRRLDRELQEDSAHQWSLKPIMDEYYEWLATLTPVQRDELRQETNPSVREKLVSQLLKAQREATGPGMLNRNLGRRGLSAADLASVLEGIEKGLIQKQLLSQQQREELERRTGLARQVYIVELSAGRESRERPGIPFAWITPEVLDDLVSRLSDEKQKRFVLEATGPDRVRRLFLLISGGIWSAYYNLRPDEATLEKFFLELKGPRQDEVMRLPPDRQQMMLMRLYMEANPEMYPRPPQFPMRQFERPWGERQRDATRPGGGPKRPLRNNRGGRPAGPQEGPPAT